MLSSLRPSLLGISLLGISPVRLSLLRSFLAACVPLAFAGCSAGVRSVELLESPPSPASVAEPTVTVSPLSPLTAEERAVAERLREEVEALVSLGERNQSDEWRLATATDHLASRLEQLGATVQRHGFEVNGVLAQNLVVEVPGLRWGDQWVVVAARFDSPVGSPGADDNASGVAGVLELLRESLTHRAQRSQRFVFWSDAGGRASPEASGAAHQVQLARRDGEAIVMLLELQGLGRYRTEPGTQQYPEGMPQGPAIGDFVNVTSYAQFAAIAERFATQLAERSSLPVRSEIWLEPQREDWAHAAFVREGYPAILVSDTGQRRDAAIGTAGDIPEALDYERMARAVVGLRRALPVLTGPIGEVPDVRDSTLPAAPEVSLPPVETSPVETSPVETSPVETSPVETPPVETPPVETSP